MYLGLEVSGSHSTQSSLTLIHIHSCIPACGCLALALSLTLPDPQLQHLSVCHLEPVGLDQSEPGLPDLSLVPVSSCLSLLASLRVRTCQPLKTSDISTHLEPGGRKAERLVQLARVGAGGQFLLSLTPVYKGERTHQGNFQKVSIGNDRGPG